MAGRAPLTEVDTKTVPRCMLLNTENKWEPARNPLNRFSTIRKDLKMQKMGPGYIFAKTMLEHNSKKTIGLVVNARGGSKIEQWSKNKRYYKDAIKRTNAAIASGGTLKGILWHQGEGNHKDTNYLMKLKSLIENLRADFNNPKLPFVAGQINNVELINNQLLKLPQEVPHTGVAKSNGLTAMDRWHFDTPSVKELGKRYAEEMLKLL